jgi:hypothetical protein
MGTQEIKEMSIHSIMEFLSNPENLKIAAKAIDLVTIEYVRAILKPDGGLNPPVEEDFQRVDILFCLRDLMNESINQL